MKKLIARVLTLAMSVALLVSCSSGRSSSDSATGSGTSKTLNLSMAASDLGGEYYTIGALFNTLWEEHIPGTLTAIQPGGSTSNIKSVSNGDALLGWTHSAVVAMAREGVAPFDKPYGGASMILASHPAAMHCMILKDSSITSISELENKKIGLGTNGSLGNTIFMQLLEEEYGITEESITRAGGTISYLGQAEAGDALRDGQIDIWIGLGPYPFNAFSDLFFNPGLKLLVPEADKMDNFLAAHTEYGRLTIPGGTYEGIADDMETLCSWNVLVVADSLDEDLVYQMTKIIWDNIDFVYAGSNTARKFMSIENPCSGWEAAGIHPGALKYYNEIGLTFDGPT